MIKFPQRWAAGLVFFIHQFMNQSISPVAIAFFCSFLRQQRAMVLFRSEFTKINLVGWLKMRIGVFWVIVWVFSDFFLTFNFGFRMLGSVIEVQSSSHRVVFLNWLMQVVFWVFFKWFVLRFRPFLEFFRPFLEFFRPFLGFFRPFLVLFRPFPLIEKIFCLDWLSFCSWSVLRQSPRWVHPNRFLHRRLWSRPRYISFQKVSRFPLNCLVFLGLGHCPHLIHNPRIRIGCFVNYLLLIVAHLLHRLSYFPHYHDLWKSHTLIQFTSPCCSVQTLCLSSIFLGIYRSILNRKLDDLECEFDHLPAFSQRS